MFRKMEMPETDGYLYYIRDDSTTFRNDNKERKEYGYHLSALQITVNLQSYWLRRYI